MDKNTWIKHFTVQVNDNDKAQKIIASFDRARRLPDGGVEVLANEEDAEDVGTQLRKLCPGSTIHEGLRQGRRLMGKPKKPPQK